MNQSVCNFKCAKTKFSRTFNGIYAHSDVTNSELSFLCGVDAYVMFTCTCTYAVDALWP